jgi:hypothetical protein
MVRAAASPKGGETVKAQVRNAANNLRLDYWTVWNAWQGKIGGRAFPKLLAAYHRWIDEQSGNEIEALRGRIERLEQNGDLAEGVDGKPRAQSAVAVRKHQASPRTVARPRD